MHHAYLFVGSRGTGKTSMAKILAASLNCQNGGPTVTPCGSASRASRSRTRRRWTSSRWTRPPTTPSTTSASCASASPSRRSPAASRSTSSTRRTCSPPRRGTRSSRRWRSPRRTRSSCWRRPRPTRSCRPSSTAAIASTSAPPVGSSPRCCAAPADAEEIAIPDEAVALVARSPPARSATPWGRWSSCSPTPARRSRWRTCWPCSARPTRTCIFGAVDAVAAGDARSALLAAASLAESGRDLGRFFGDLEAHARALMVVQVLGDVPAGAARHERAGRAPGRAGRPRRPRPTSSA